MLYDTRIKVDKFARSCFVCAQKAKVMRTTHFSSATKCLAGVTFLIVAALQLPGEALAAYNVNISSAASVNGNWSGGVWTPSGAGANVSAAEIMIRLTAGSAVTITTSNAGSDAGNISLNSDLSWNTGTLTLSAQNDININAVMSAAGSSALVMAMGTGMLKVGFAPGEATGFAGRVDFPGRSGSGFLTINGAAYTVINSLGGAGSTSALDLQGIRNSLGGNYALGADINASATKDWNSGAGFLPIGDNALKTAESWFTGVFDGLGHTVNGLVINRPEIEKVGLFGHTGTSTLRNVGFTGASVNGQNYVGGLAGYTDGTINNCYYSGSVSGGYNVGGLAGHNNGFINNAYATGAVSGSFSVGGLVGTNSATIANSFAGGSVMGGIETGGLLGLNISGIVINCYASGNVSGVDDTGGLVGNNFAGINFSYAVGGVSGASKFGGLVGENAGNSVTNSFWDTQTSGQASSAAGIPKTTAEMKQLSTFTAAGWSIDSGDGSGSVWRILEGQSYPQLSSSAAGTINNPPDQTYKLIVAVGGAGTGMVTSSPAGIDCDNGTSGIFVTCTNNFPGTINLYAAPSELAIFGGWGGACLGLGACSVAMDAEKTVTALFNPAVLMQIDGTVFKSLQAVYDATSDGAVILLLDNTVAGTLDAKRNIIVKLRGGYNAVNPAFVGISTVTAPLIISQGTIVANGIAIR